MITIVDYGMGNLGSLENMLKRVGGDGRISSNPEEIASAQKLILPGVGHFDHAINRLVGTGLSEVLNNKVMKDKTPILCICLGAQLVTQSSEEGTLPGFGWIKAKTVRFNSLNETEMRIPHMGWNDVSIKKNSLLFTDMHSEPCFYFVHSYHFVCENPKDILTTTVYGYEFASAMEHDNIYALQFHPEKSHKYGMKLMKNFVELKEC